MKDYRIVSYKGTAGLTYYAVEEKHKFLWLFPVWLTERDGFGNEGEAENRVKQVIDEKDYGVKVHQVFEVDQTK